MRAGDYAARATGYGNPDNDPAALAACAQTEALLAIGAAIEGLADQLAQLAGPLGPFGSAG